ncbi:MAG: hypothetical protein J3K34DRAFT_438488 [Monoraphidium minutum]|nr:MAG: hypothetical protein J3K34DRAFT_438488 [Monoraphidium minutum]
MRVHLYACLVDGRSNRRASASRQQAACGVVSGLCQGAAAAHAPPRAGMHSSVGGWVLRCQVILMGSTQSAAGGVGRPPPTVVSSSQSRAKGARRCAPPPHAVKNRPSRALVARGGRWARGRVALGALRKSHSCRQACSDATHVPQPSPGA